MPRISDQELARVKETPLETLARARGFALEKRGNDLALSCPFHEEKTASCIITPSKNIFHCFGCGEGGSVIDWVMKLESVSFRHAVEILTNDPTATGPQTVNKLQNPFDASKPILDQSMSFYQSAIVDEPALAFLEKRGLLEAIEPFKLGASNRTLGLHLPLKNRKEGAEIRMRLIEAGIYRANGREHLRGSVVVPFFQGDVITEMYGRKYGKGLRKGTPMHLYLKGQHKGILNHQNLAHEIILCEAPLDAMSFFVAGVSSVTTSFGTEGVTDELFERLIKAKKIHIAFDNDNAGNRAAKNLAERLVRHDVEVHRVEFPNEQDANDVLVKQGKKQLLKLVKRSAFVGGISIPEKAKPLVAKAKTATTETTETEGPKEQTQAANKSALNVSVTKDEATIEFSDRRYRVRNLKKNLSFGVMKINILVKKGERFHVDNLDLYMAKSRAAFAKAVSVELGTTVESAKKDLGKLLLLLDEYQSEAIDQNAEDKLVELTEEETKEAMALLQNPNLMDQILDDFETLGMVGEETNKLTGYLAAISRKLSKPLAIVVQSSSAAGKSSLMDAVLAFVPEEEKVAYSAMTGQSLFYMEGGNLKHKVLAVAEEEGAERASYALKILQSEGKLKIASTGKDVDTGRHTTSAYEVEGPTAIFTTTTSIDVDEELLNRCLVLTVDEDQAQTSEIQNLQRVARSKLKEREAAEQTLTLHQNAQRLLSPLEVVNPYAPFLTFPSHQVRLRRDHAKYLTLIDTIALLHQHQRQIHEQKERAFVNVEPQDIDVANQIFKAIMRRSLDELPPQTRRVLESIDKYVQTRMKAESAERSEIIFTRKQVRDQLQIGATQLHLHLQRLTELEYVGTSRLKGSRTLLYRLVFGATHDDDLNFIFTSGKEAHTKANQIRPKFAPYSGQIRTSEIVRKLRASEDMKHDRQGKFANSQECKNADILELSYKKSRK